jgi:hypothetical protein
LYRGRGLDIDAAHDTEIEPQMEERSSLKLSLADILAALFQNSISIGNTYYTCVCFVKMVADAAASGVVKHKRRNLMKSGQSIYIKQF